MSDISTKDLIRARILAAGFDRVGFATAAKAPGAPHFRDWLQRGFAGEMHWLERNIERRVDPRNVLEGTRTVISVALHYAPPTPSPAEIQSEGDPPRGQISSYAQGTDYHRVIEKRIKAVCRELADLEPARYRWYVDTGPVLERDWAQAAGIGWIGKNTCSIHPEHGSYFFLGTILTTLDIEPDGVATNHCGTCRLCLDSCPTDAFAGPYQLDARRCISYLTIEHRGPYEESLEEQVGDWVFGCDICQAVCPFNSGERGRSQHSGGDRTPRRQ